MLEKMRTIIDQLNEASDVYYNTSTEIMSNREYDDLFDKLKKMEKETGVVLHDSPTQNTGYAVMDNLPKVIHEFPARSLDKTKDIQEFFKVFRNKAIVMWKMDGSTIQLTYNKGKLITAATRGNGEVGSDITHNAPYIKGIPQSIPYDGKLVVRGEAVMSYKEFDRINSGLSMEDQYKNPRNLANASIMMLDSKEMTKREIVFFAFRMVFKEDNKSPFMEKQLTELKKLRFNVVEYNLCNVTQLKEIMDEFSSRTDSFLYPVDGLVVADNDIEYAEGLPGTNHHPNKLAGYAFKWADEVVETKLLNIEWSPSRIGLINPVAIFEPVELEGTTVSRASLHNVSEMQRLLGDSPYEGEKIWVYKANKIIPAISHSEASTEESAVFKKLPVTPLCPSCGFVTNIVANKSLSGKIIKTLWCKNPECPAKQIGRFEHFADRDCMDIRGISGEIIKKLADKGFIRRLSDLYTLEKSPEIAEMEGFGEKMFANMIAAADESRKSASFIKLIHALGIPNIGLGQAKVLYQHYKEEMNLGNDYMENFITDLKAGMDFTCIPSIGPVLDKSLKDWAKIQLEDGSEFMELYRETGLKFIESKTSTSDALSGMTFVITGSLNGYANRDELVSVIEANGGKASGSVSKKTTYLINNDNTSTSSKNKKALDLGIKILTEEEFNALLK